MADKDNSQLLPRMRDLIEDLRAEWRGLDDRIAAFDAEFVRAGACHPSVPAFFRCDQTQMLARRDWYAVPCNRTVMLPSSWTSLLALHGDGVA